MVCDPIPQLLVSHTCGCGTSPAHRRPQGALSRSRHSGFRDPSARGLYTQWGGRLELGLHEASCLTRRFLSNQNV